MTITSTQPIRGELYSIDRLEQFAPELAAKHHILPGRHQGRPVLARLKDNRRALVAAARIIAADARSGVAVTPAAEWLIDNFGLVEEQLREIEEDLPPGFYFELPKLVDGERAGYPRVYALVWAYVEHTDSRFDPESLKRFVCAYQEVQALTIGELWAIAISLRLVLVENLRRLADSIVHRREERAQADELAEALLDPSRVLKIRRRLRALERAPLPTAFSVQLIQRLRDRDPTTTPGLLWLNEQLSRHNSTAEDVVRAEHVQVAAMQGPVRDGITSMRALSAVDWADFVEDVSLLEAALRGHATVSPLDFDTRDRYRHAVEELARNSSWTEVAIGKLVSEKAKGSGIPRGSRESDPGYHLISTGRAALEVEIGYRAPALQTVRRVLSRAPTLGYVGAIGVVTAGVLAVPLWAATALGASVLEGVALGLLALIPASEMAIGLVNRSVARLVGPRKLPKLALESGVPAELRTMVVIPTLLTDEAEVYALIERLEVHFLANDDGDLRFALVSDWPDALTERVDGDDTLLELARERIASLNERHGPVAGGPRFFLLHRGRRWNERQGCWMGWERKRGKLHELNRLLRGATDTTFLPEELGAAADSAGVSVASLTALGIRYIITLDSDTRLPYGSAKRLIGAIAHPLNRAVHHPVTHCVIEGYGILQPRITPTLPETGEGTVAQRVYSGPAGIDPYAFAISDVYQDLFGEGSYTGKGIYDVDAFEIALEGRVPENTMLSHDLFEGLHARAGLLTDIELFESFPAHYQVSAARQHRWARGDWQLLPWILGRGRISAIGRWKMLDNLRRTLVAPACLATLLAGWLLPDGRPWVWTLFVGATLIVPVLLPVLLDLLPRRSGLALRSFARAIGGDLVLGLLRVGLGIALLAEQAWQMVDAIVRTLYRLTFSRRRMLEWVTAAQVKLGSRLELGAFQREMARSVGLTVLALLAVVRVAPHSVGLAASFATLWILSPVIARWISAPPVARVRARLDDRGSYQLRLTARRTWRYFESFVTAADHHLPPDNYQEDPTPAVAHRTSPTNIGLYVLSAVSAHDMGWLGTLGFIERIEATLGTLDTMERHRGHLYNWYDTTTLVPLTPRYVSTVDSGNLAGHLLALQQACLELANYTPTIPRAFAGIADALAIAREAIAAIGDDPRDGSIRSHQLVESADEIGAILHGGGVADGVWDALLAKSEVFVDTAQALAQERGGAAYTDTYDWARMVRSAIAGHVRDRVLVDGGFFDAAPSGEGAVWESPFRGSPAERLTRLAERAERLSQEMEWGFLYEADQRLFSIGYNVDHGRLDVSSYDLLASECRLASFLAIAKGDVPVSHWFRLGRRLTPVGAGSVLVSWSGSMFEYLMPELVMATPEGSLLDQTDRLVVARQIAYGAARGVPWGISESAYNARDLDLTYQYANFGVSGLGLKRGLADDLVIAPYATALASMVDPAAAAENLTSLARVGASGRFGFYESVDYTIARLPEGTHSAVVKAYFAHHQGMSIVALCSTIGGFAMRRRFHASPMVQAAVLLLHERTPRHVAVARSHTDEAAMHLHVREVVPPVLRKFNSPHDALPATHRLSNGRYSVAFTVAGAGQSLWKDLAVTRWREDETLDAWGSFIYIRDVVSGRVWSAGHQPTGAEADAYSASFFEHRVEIRRRDGSISTTLEVVVSSEDDAEVRQVTIVNNGDRLRTLELTSYSEVVLAPDAADVAHPAFSNLFVQTEFEPAAEALLASRRPRSAVEHRVWAAHVSAVHGVGLEGVQFETDRARFIGRGRGVRTASAIFEGRPLSNTVGAVLDPIFSLRRRVTLAPGQTAKVTFTTLVGANRERVLALCDTYRDVGMFERTLGQAWTHAQVQLRHLGIDPEEAQLYQRLASRVLYAGRAMRAAKEVLERNRLGQSALWRFGISGDRPLLLGRIANMEDRDLVRQLVHAHCYWKMKGLSIDLVILNEQFHTYGQDLHEDLEGLVRASHFAGVLNGVHLIRGEHLGAEDRDMLLASARVVVDSHDGSLSEQVIRQLRHDSGPPAPRATSPSPLPASPGTEVSAPRPELDFFNGIGGFSTDGRDYVIVMGARQWTPLPWVNVIANPSFGFLVSEAGGGFTWAENSHENQLTPWSNDPVSDPPGEVLYIRDDDTGETWTATPLPVREDTPYVVHHGQGFTTFTHESHGIALELVQFVAPEAPVKVSRLRIRNTSGRERRLSVAAYAEWVLGPSRAASTPFVVTSIDPVTGAIFARNPWKADFASRVAFLDLRGRQRITSGDRAEWIGRNGSLATPAGLSRERTGGGRVGPGLDPCAMLMTTIHLLPGESESVVALLGQADGEAEARSLVQRAREADPEALLREVVARWDAILEVVQVKTPDRAMDLLMNRWLLYQTLSCRIWARAGFYQAGGAYGFRDQLQDGMALAIARPDLTREHILRAAAHQFPEGDVQHWWHPPSGKGVRTRFADDRIWLPFTVSHYIEVTGEAAVLDEVVPYLDGPILTPEQEDTYQEPRVSSEVGTLYEHAARALDVSLGVGRHGLPLMGGGDWNDGMNRVGNQGEGESVWLAWFLISTLDRWIPIAEARGDTPRATAWRAHTAALRIAVEAEAWDGDWYRRAYMDDGSPLGSAANVECRIDSIAQSWSVLSGAGQPDRAVRAMASLEEHLVRRADGVVLLLTPPFDRTPLDPGYIKGYLPGIRENGGQYTHAALWALMAFAELGDGNKASEIFAMLNPVNRANTRAGLQRYKGEPYVAAADVYGAGVQMGRGGWTWYTGSASWMYRAGLEWILGVRVRGDHLHLAPCVPTSWPSFEVSLKHGGARYEITVLNPRGVQRGIATLTLDDVALDPAAARVPLVDDGATHRVRVTLGAQTEPNQ
ncbi:MAG: glucoamylase family protein [Pseudomonadota bacterium]|nr:glucoamylase family protein [Pseudomonadota bacterium]